MHCSFDSYRLDFETAKKYLKKKKFPIVLKADGLAAGKGVWVAKNIEEANHFLKSVMVDKIFGESGNQVVIEQCLEGLELSVLALIDGESIKILPEARDHKRAFDHNEGPNTGGMGAYSPVPGIGNDLITRVTKEVFEPLLKGLKNSGSAYRGVLYAGLMLTPSGPQVLEFNVRFGDPETQVILPRIESDLLDLMLACCDGTLTRQKIQIKNETALCVALASGGYPEHYENGFKIQGLPEIAKMKDILVFHAGTRRQDHGYVTQGGRVLGVTSCGTSMEHARKKVYTAIGKIQFQGMHFRKDIGES